MDRPSRRRRRSGALPTQFIAGRNANMNIDPTTLPFDSKPTTARALASTSTSTVSPLSSSSGSRLVNDVSPRHSSMVKGRRSPSPARIVLMKEHAELQILNDRLSSHADDMTQLQNENARLRLKLETMEGIIRQETMNMRQLNDSDYHTMQASLDVAIQERNDLKKSCDAMSKELQLEKTRLERELSSMKADFDLKVLELKKGYLKEVEKASARFDNHFRQTECRLEESYEMQVRLSMASFREQLRRDLEGMKEEVTSVYHTNFFEWKDKFERCNADLLASVKASKVAEQNQTRLQDQMTEVKAAKAAVEVHLEESHARNDEIKNQAEKDRCQAQKEIALLSLELSEYKDELYELGLANGRLEKDFTAYRVILDDLESKSPFCHRKGCLESESSSIQYGSNADANCLGPSEMEGGNSMHSGVVTNGRAMIVTYIRRGDSDAIKISTVDVDGRYVSLHNAADHTIDLCLWMLHQTDRHGTQVEYEIPSETLVASGGYVTIWGQGHCPGEDDSAATKFTGGLESHEDPPTGYDGARAGPTFRGIHLVMDDRSWLQLQGRCQFLLKDGDSQTQDECDVIATRIDGSENSTAGQYIRGARGRQVTSRGRERDSSELGVGRNAFLDHSTTPRRRTLSRERESVVCDRPTSLEEFDSRGGGDGDVIGERIDKVSCRVI